MTTTNSPASHSMYGFTNERTDARRALGLIGSAIGLWGVSALLAWLMTTMSYVSGRGVLIVLIGPIVGAVLFLIGSGRFIYTALRFGMYGSLMCFLLVTTALGYGGQQWWQSRRLESERRAAIQRAFEGEEHIRPLVEIAGLKEELRPGALRGKVAVVFDEWTDHRGTKDAWMSLVAGPEGDELNPARARWHELVFELPREMQAENPAAVETIIWIKGVRRPTGVYQSAPGLEQFPDYAYRYEATIKVVNRQTATVVATHRIVGEAPPEKKPTGEQTGQLPVKEIAEYLKGLLPG